MYQTFYCELPHCTFHVSLSFLLIALESRCPTKPFIVVVKRGRDGYVRNGQSPYGIQNREDSGARLKTAEYGRPCVPHGKSGNL